MVTRDKAFYQRMVENALDVVTVLSNDGKIVYNSPSLETTFGFKPAELNGGDVAQFIHEDDQQAVAEQLVGILNGALTVGESEFRFKHKSGGYRYIQAIARRWEVDGEFGVLVNSRDVTSQRETLETLGHTNQLLSSIYSATSNMISVSLPESGKFLEVNDAWCAVTGYSREEAIGHTAIELGVWGSTENRDMVLAVLNEKGSLENFRTKIYDRHGREREAVVDARYLEVAGEKRILMACQDISELMQVEDELRQAQKMEVVGQLTGGVAHDFNNLISIIMGNADLLRLRLEDETLEPFLDKIVDASEMAANLTQKLLSFSRIQNLSPIALNLSERVTGMLTLLQSSVRENTELRLEVGDSLSMCQLDPTQFESALLNLTLNAKDAMPDGGKISYQCSVEHLDPAQDSKLLGSNQPGYYVRLSVTDTGIGMSKEVLDKVFEPFFTTKEIGRGTGLGLSMVFGFVKQSGGLVDIESEEGIGTSVSIYFPQTTFEPSSAVRDQPVQQPTVLGTGTALIIEDNVPLRSILSGYLEEIGYTVHEAASADEVNDLTPRLNAIDLIISDVMLEGPLKGPEIVNELHRQFPSCRVLYITGYSPADVLDEDAPSLSKPFSRNTFRQAIAGLSELSQPPDQRE